MISDHLYFTGMFVIKFLGGMPPSRKVVVGVQLYYTNTQLYCICRRWFLLESAGCCFQVLFAMLIVFLPRCNMCLLV